jgi:hypothetical protein
MRSAGLLALPLVAGAVVGLVVDGGTGLAVALGGLLAAIASVIVLTPGRGRDIAAGGAVADAASGWAEFHRELARARRFDRPFAIVRLAPEAGHDAGELMAVRDDVAAMARRTDRIWIDGDDVLALLPETSTATAARFVERLQERPIVVPAQASIAAFPDDGITSGALISVAYGGAAVVPTPISAVRADPRPSTDADAAPEVVGQGG